MVNRLLNILLSNSFFLFGARGTGKTRLLGQILPKDELVLIDLLDPLVLESYALEPNRLLELAFNPKTRPQWIAIDEVQKLPKLLDLVHKCIEDFGVKFALTGSSARKLKRGGANLLAGRAFVYHLFPLTARELAEQFNLREALEWGTLPRISALPDIKEREIYLRTYCQTYLKEEITEEQIVRKLDPFRAFLQVAAQTNGQVVNYAKVARGVGVSTVTAQSYYQIMEDTLLGFNLQPFHRSIRRRQSGNPKFYLFDTGIQRALSRTLTVNLEPGTYAFGRAFEHFIVNEVNRLQSYLQRDFELSYLRTKDGAEIDLIIDRPGLPLALLEIKSSERIVEGDLKNLERFNRDIGGCEAFCLSRDPLARTIGKVRVLPWERGLEELGLGLR